MRKRWCLDDNGRNGRFVSEVGVAMPSDTDWKMEVFSPWVEAMLAESSSLSHYFISRAMVEKGNRGKFLEWDDMERKARGKCTCGESGIHRWVKFSFGVIHVFSHGAPPAACILNLKAQIRCSFKQVKRNGYGPSELSCCVAQLYALYSSTMLLGLLPRC